MSFEVAALIVVAVIAIALALVAYQLLARLEQLEQAIHGGLTPPSTRLAREQFERRFAAAKQRAALAAEVGTGLLIIIGAEHPGSDLEAILAHLPRQDLVTVREAIAADRAELGVTTTPYLFVVDDERVREARPLAGPADLVSTLQDLT